MEINSVLTFLGTNSFNKLKLPPAVTANYMPRSIELAGTQVGQYSILCTYFGTVGTSNWNNWCFRWPLAKHGFLGFTALAIPVGLTIAPAAQWACFLLLGCLDA